MHGIKTKNINNSEFEFSNIFIGYGPRGPSYDQAAPYLFSHRSFK